MSALSTVIARGTLASRPSAGNTGRLYTATDTGATYRDNGSSWDKVTDLAVTSMPGSPATNDTIHRSDLPCGLFRYDGTQWRCMGGHSLYFGSYDNQSADTGLIRQPPAAFGGSDLYLLSLVVTAFVVTTNDGSKYWNIPLVKVTAGDVGTTVATATTQSLTPSNDLLITQAINAAMGGTATYKQLQTKFSKVSTPGNIYGGITLTYQVIAT